MSAQLHTTGDGEWLISCVPCALVPDDSTATDYDTAQHRATVHNCEQHNRFERPDWGELNEWLDRRRSAEDREPIR